MLREQLGFRGLIVSDCMMMGAIQDYYGTVPGCLAAAKAGVDLLFVSHSMELAAQVARALAEEAAAGRLDAGELAASVARMYACGSICPRRRASRPWAVRPIGRPSGPCAGRG